MVQRVADRLGGGSPGGKPRHLNLEPGAQIHHQRPALRSADCEPVLWALAAEGPVIPMTTRMLAMTVKMRRRVLPVSLSMTSCLH